MKLYKCKHCGNVAWKLVDSGVGMVCCGEAMSLMTPGTTDGALEKHVPVVKSADGKTVVQVGEVVHPMQAEHYIQFIAAERSDKNRVIVQFLNPGETPEMTVCGNPEGLTAYEYCNLHGFWKSGE